MSNVLPLALAIVAGLFLGAMFFGGLWWTVRKGVLSARPAMWFLSSLLLRMGLALVGFYFVGRGHWERLVACLLGFVMARLVVKWLTQPSAKDRDRTPQEASHAP